MGAPVRAVRRGSTNPLASKDVKVKVDRPEDADGVYRPKKAEPDNDPVFDPPEEEKKGCCVIL